MQEYFEFQLEFSNFQANNITRSIPDKGADISFTRTLTTVDSLVRIIDLRGREACVAWQMRFWEKIKVGQPLK